MKNKNLMHVQYYMAQKRYNNRIKVSKTDSIKKNSLFWSWIYLFHQAPWSVLGFVFYNAIKKH